jgi:hypothetical protein
VLREVSVLCGAGGGLTAQPLNTSETSMPAVAETRRARVGTPHRVSVPLFPSTLNAMR